MSGVPSRREHKLSRPPWARKWESFSHHAGDLPSHQGRTRHSVNMSFSTGRNNRLVSGFFPGLEQTHRFVSRPTKLSVRFGRPDLFRTRTPHLFSVILPPPKCGYSGLDCKLKQADCSAGSVDYPADLTDCSAGSAAGARVKNCPSSNVATAA